MDPLDLGADELAEQLGDFEPFVADYSGKVAIFSQKMRKNRWKFLFFSLKIQFFKRKCSDSLENSVLKA